MAKTHPTAEEIIRSATAAIRVVTSSKEISDDHKAKLVDRMLWSLTEEPTGKYSTPIRSAASVGQPQKELRHEHVFTRKWLKRELLQKPEHLDSLVKFAIACVVTKAEAKLLDRVAKDLQGWDRYREAGIALVSVDAAGKMSPFVPPAR